MPLFADENTDTDVNLPPTFAEKPRPLKVSTWQQKISAGVCGQKYFPDAEKKKPANKSDPPSAPNKRKRDSDKKLWWCNTCRVNHQVGQQCSKRRKTDTAKTKKKKKKKKKQKGTGGPKSSNQ